jgi:glutamate-1-semialdehyde 2,1-aminomutase
MSVTTSARDLRLERLIEAEEAGFRERHPRSRDLLARARRSLAGGVASSWQTTDPHPVYVSHGRGSRVWDVDGNDYVDLHNGYGAVAVGHAHPAVVEAVSRRVARGTHFAQPTEEALLVAEHLRERFGLPLWRFAVTGRDVVLKIEGSYHGHHDALMVSVTPPADAVGPADDPVSVPQTPGLPDAYVKLTRVVPFNDLAALERALARQRGRVAGLVVEPVMMNIGMVLPDDGYLAAARELLHRHGALLAFDEVKTGATIHHGGATRRFGVEPDLICLAKSAGGGLCIGAIGGSEEVMGWVADGRIDQVGTFNGNPLSMAAALAALTQALTPEAYTIFERQARLLREGCDEVLARHGVEAQTTALAARGAITYRRERARNYRDFLEASDELAYANWLVQLNRGVFLPPWGKAENWTLSVQHSDDDVLRFVENLEVLAAAVGG